MVLRIDKLIHEVITLNPKPKDVEILEHRLFGAMVEHVFENFVAKAGRFGVSGLLSIPTWRVRGT